MTPGKAIVAAVCCVVLILVLVWLQRAEKAEARERAMAQPPKPLPIRFEFTRALDHAEMPAIEQLELTQDERDALVEGLYEWIGPLDSSIDTSKEAN